MTGKLARTRVGFLALSGSLLLLVSGCPDPEAAYEEFNSSWCEVQANRLDNPPSNYCSCATDADCGTEESGKVCGPDGICQLGCRGSGTGNTCPSGIDCSSTDDSIGKCGMTCEGPGAALGEPDGLYYLTIAPPVSPFKPAPYLVTITSSQADSVVQVTFDSEPVSADDRFSVVGEPLPRGPFNLQPNGAFDADWGEFIMPGDTNPLTGSDLTLHLRFVGRFCADQTAEPTCGQGLGAITAPVNLNLDGTNFYMEKIDDIADHTEPPYLRCDGTQANPL